MYRITFYLLVIMAASAFGGSIMPRRASYLDGRIVGGKDTTIQEHPHQVSVRLFNSHRCGGSIIGPKVILTAAHCLVGIWPALTFSVQFGVTFLGGIKNSIAAIDLDIHPNYDSRTADNDIGLMFLISKIVFSAAAQPIALATVALEPGTDVVITGWGYLTEGGPSPTILKQAIVQAISTTQCKEEYSRISDITQGMLCAYAKGKDSCQGDSGGPAVAGGILVGIVSWGQGCARVGYSGVYTNVSHYNAWVEKKLRLFSID